MARNKDIHSLKLHETIQIENMEVTRVPGGWIYRFQSRHYQHSNSNLKGGSECAVFVPLVNNHDSSTGPK